jgi:hypothetical protein
MKPVKGISSWKRIKRILGPEGSPANYPRYTQLPTVIVIPSGLIRVFYSPRTIRNTATSFFIDVDPENGMKVVFQSFKPSLATGSKGNIDQDGIALTSVLKQDHMFKGYYTALNLDEIPNFKTQIGYIESQDSELFKPETKIVCLPLSKENPHMTMAPYVKYINGMFHMWYASTIYWNTNAKPNPEYCYHIKHATSSNGIDWVLSERTAINFASMDEGGITRPTVIQNRDHFEMWYCYRGHFSLEYPEKRYYRIGYAVSYDLIHWERQDNNHFWVNPPMEGEWDYHMQCYPDVIEYNGKQFMFYCGNDYSQGGLGVAERVIYE